MDWEKWPLNAYVDWETKTVRFMVPDGSGMYVGSLDAGWKHANKLQDENAGLRVERDVLRADIACLVRALRPITNDPAIPLLFDRQLSPFTLMELTK
jgi:hypothetical protein